MSIAAGSLVAPNVRLAHRLGEGGMGEVWVADHLTLERQVAVKLIRSLADGENARARFEREAKAAARITNPHVVQVFDYGLTQAGMPFIIMELLAGENLAHRIGRGPVSPAELAPILVQTANALAAAHECGVVHRDVKPPNIFLVQTPSGEPFVKVLDFGIAMLQGDATGILSGGAQADTPAPGSGGNALTQTGALLGTPEYMSPEQLLTTGEEITHRTDIWSLGVVAYEALIGARPFSGQTVVALCMSICEARYDRERVPPHLRAWFDRVFAVSPADRFDSVMDAAESFRRLVANPAGGQDTVVASGPLASGPSASGPLASAPPAGLSRGAVIGFALAACVIGAILVFLLAMPRDDGPKKVAKKDAASKTVNDKSKKKKRKKSGKKKKKKKKKKSEPTEAVAPAPPEPSETTPEPEPAPSEQPEPASPSPPTAPAAPRPPTVPAKCKTSCADVGACGESGGACVVRSSADCKQSNLCRTLGRCTKVGSVCTATSAADCAATTRCKTYGACGFSGNSCVPTSAAHCRQSTRCASDGKCTVSGVYCVPGSDADCKAAAVCGRTGACFKNGMVCSATKR